MNYNEKSSLQYLRRPKICRSAAGRYVGGSRSFSSTRNIRRAWSLRPEVVESSCQRNGSMTTALKSFKDGIKGAIVMAPLC